MMRWIGIVIILFLAGCGGGQKSSADFLAECQQENTELAARLEGVQKQRAQLEKQLYSLMAIDKNVRDRELDTVRSVKIGNHSGIYDKDENGTKETLVVYLEVMDKEQDYIKAPGRCTVELWDLNAPEDEAKLTRFTLAQTYLSQVWGGTIFHSYYRIVRPLDVIEDYILQKKPEVLTLKVAFTDYYTGNVLTDQKVLEIQY